MGGVLLCSREFGRADLETIMFRRESCRAKRCSPVSLRADIHLFDSFMKIFCRLALVVLGVCIQEAGAQGTLKVLEGLAKADSKPFVLVEGSGKATKDRAQGVVVSAEGHVLSAGHVAWIEADRAFTDKFRVSFRGSGKGLPGKAAHVHKTLFSDREDAPFLEHYFPATLQKRNGTRFLGDGDLAIFRIDSEGRFPKMEFFSKTKPAMAVGDILHLCHFTFPHKPGDPFFLINPVEVVGIAQTSSGIQYLAKGYYRVGSSGGAILKDGRLIGIQSSAYTVNAKGVGEVPVGLISFELVWGDLIEDALKSPAEDLGEAATGAEGGDDGASESGGRSR